MFIIQGDWNAKIGTDTLTNRNKYCGPSCNNSTNDRGIRLLEFICYNYMIVANTLGIYKSSRIASWHSSDGKTNNQIDYILMKRRFISDINVAKTRVYNNAYIGSEYDLVIILQTIIQISKKTKEHSQKL